MISFFKPMISVLPTHFCVRYSFINVFRFCWFRGKLKKKRRKYESYAVTQYDMLVHSSVPVVCFKEMKGVTDYHELTWFSVVVLVVVLYCMWQVGPVWLTLGSSPTPADAMRGVKVSETLLGFFPMTTAIWHLHLDCWGPPPTIIIMFASK